MPISSPRRSCAIAVVSLSLLAACDQPASDSAAAAPPALPVDVARPVVKEVTEWDFYTGRFEAIEYVDVRARVSGYLRDVHFRDGQTVNKGDLLFSIDPRPFEAALAGARAEVARAEAEVELADLSLRRAERLLQSSAGSRERVENRRADKLTAEAELAGAIAAEREAALELEFTRITSPITGRISDRRVDVGNLISGGSTQTATLATIVSLDPIYFVFDASEADYLKYARLSRTGDRPSSRDAANPVFVRLIDESGWDRQGQMDFVDNAFDPGSGTIRGRAIFDNPDLVLTPGLFGRMRLIGSGAYTAVLLPDEAILSDQSRKIVLTVDGDGTVAVRPVVLGPVIDGLRVIRSGLDAGDNVIVRGVQRARPGRKVVPQQVAIEDLLAARDGG